MQRLKISLVTIILAVTFTNCFVDRETYEKIKAEAPFEVLSYEEVKEIFGDQTKADFQRYKGQNHLLSPEIFAKLDEEAEKSFLEQEPIFKGITLPVEFDWRKVMPDCITPIKNQAFCGSCYSFSVTGALESRICIQSGNKLHPELSQQNIISCDSKNLKCQGDRLDNTWRFLENVGTCSHHCQPYESANGYVPLCSSKCKDPSFTFYKWRAKPGTWKIMRDPLQIKAEIYQYGPVSAGIQTFEDLSTFKGPGIYIHTVGEETDHHAIVIVGWGYDMNYKKEYWIIRNSWGNNWGDNGYFKILFGMYEAEYMVNASQPLV